MSPAELDLTALRAETERMDRAGIIHWRTKITGRDLLALLDRLENAESARDHWEKAFRCATIRAEAAEAKLEPTYHETPEGHLDAWADTGEGYTQHNGWTLRCIWCGLTFEGGIKATALAKYRAHEDEMRSRAARAIRALDGE